jgi:hypothetical protein
MFRFHLKIARTKRVFFKFGAEMQVMVYDVPGESNITFVWNRGFHRSIAVNQRQLILAAIRQSWDTSAHCPTSSVGKAFERKE